MKNIIRFLKTKWYYVAAAVVLIIVLVVVIRRRKANNENTKGGSGGSSTLTGVLEADAKYPLSPQQLVGVYSTEKGSMGKQISTLQKTYNQHRSGGTGLDVDGKYGPQSLSAFQRLFADYINADGTITKEQYEAIVKKYS